MKKPRVREESPGHESGRHDRRETGGETSCEESPHRDEGLGHDEKEDNT